MNAPTSSPSTAPQAPGNNPSAADIVRFVEYVVSEAPQAGPLRMAILTRFRVDERRFQGWHGCLQDYREKAGIPEHAKVASIQGGTSEAATNVIQAKAGNPFYTPPLPHVSPSGTARRTYVKLEKAVITQPIVPEVHPHVSTDTYGTGLNAEEETELASLQENLHINPKIAGKTAHITTQQREKLSRIGDLLKKKKHGLLNQYLKTQSIDSPDFYRMVRPYKNGVASASSESQEGVDATESTLEPEEVQELATLLEELKAEIKTGPYDLEINTKRKLVRAYTLLTKKGGASLAKEYVNQRGLGRAIHVYRVDISKADAFEQLPEDEKEEVKGLLAELETEIRKKEDDTPQIIFLPTKKKLVRACEILKKAGLMTELLRKYSISYQSFSNYEKAVKKAGNAGGAPSENTVATDKADTGTILHETIQDTPIINRNTEPEPATEQTHESQPVAEIPTAPSNDTVHHQNGHISSTHEPMHAPTATPIDSARNDVETLTIEAITTDEVKELDALLKEVVVPSLVVGGPPRTFNARTTQRVIRLSVLLRKKSEEEWKAFLRKHSLAQTTVDKWIKDSEYDGKSCIPEVTREPMKSLSKFVAKPGNGDTNGDEEDDEDEAPPAATVPRTFARPKESLEIITYPNGCIRETVSQRPLPKNTLLQNKKDAERALRESGLVVEGDAKMEEMWQQVIDASRGDRNVLLRGETGTGKELIAKAIHTLHSMNMQNQAIFFALNCAGISEGVVEAELFGHVKGAFTNASADRKGAFEEVRYGGTLLLDEIGDMPLDQQAKLLRVLQQRTFSRVGKNEPLELVNTKIVASTNRNLNELVDQGLFRMDLLHRLSEHEVYIPALEERSAEHRIKLIQRFLALHSTRDSMVYINQAGLDYVLGIDHDGNVRDLQNHIRQAYDIASRGIEGDVLVTKESLEAVINRTKIRNNDYILGDLHLEEQGASSGEAEEYEKLDFKLASIEVQTRIKLIKAVLKKTEGNQSVAAKMMGITRGTLRAYLRSYGIVISHSVESD